ncbi:MAG: cysteinyl-tRNA synthetase CysS [Roseibaca calidilacus]|uniref:Cysteine--tRNA ligase n=1 Tax=Roseibaca calidilacus TaxID=1666912 RepID=A0A0P8AMK3_9RHOB|nr:cysteine--tRNA ligase [Roseibaca calidilacus]KPP95920.1 MAG: cysteinyl-tRNA synthetase CysS [Roseibaca calidilacus]CUX81490.1 cysteinyl-tRNA synthetase [Roseibaca calidilacus]
MTQITLHNTRTRRKEAFAPIDPENVRMYVCGPTVYDRAHLGNARPVVVFDVLYRLLRHVYGEDHVTYVRNFTDVDDKINARARAMQEAGDTRELNAIIRSLTDETIEWYHADMDALGALRPDHAPRATEYIVQMVAMIEGLIAKGHAYPAEGHVLFDVRSYPDYGSLSGRSVDDMIAGARVEVAPYKRDPMDFVLWKPSASDEPGWNSPWGRGRPGWHIECSAMADELLGASFDIHGGGIDLQFPHHENEIAQSCCAHPDAGFANFWLHNEMVQVEGKKMSKSLGNFFTVRDLLDQGWPGEVIRFVMLSTHYRKPMDWTEEKADAADLKLSEMWRTVSNFADATRADPTKVSSSIVAALADDLNTHAALAALHQVHAEARKSGDAAQLANDLALLGLLNADFSTTPRPMFASDKLLFDLADRLSNVRSEAVRTKNFEALDLLKKQFQKAGLEVRMSKTGVDLLPGPDFDPSKLEGLE